MKFQTPTIGGVRKVIRTDNNVTVGTTIAEVGSNTITLAQLAQIITQIQSQQQNNGGGNVGGGAEASIVLGPGLSGGGVLVGNVPIRLTAPIPWGIEDGGIDGDPGPPGAAGPQGVMGSQGPQGIPGTSGTGSGSGLVVWVPEENWPDDIGIPGPTGPAGAVGATGAQGPAGTGTGGGAGTMAFWVPEENWPDDPIVAFNPNILGPGTIKVAGTLTTISGMTYLTPGAGNTVTTLSFSGGVLGTISYDGSADQMTIRAINWALYGGNGPNYNFMTVGAAAPPVFQPCATANSSSLIAIGGTSAIAPAIQAQGSATISNSRGILISAGSNASDYAILAQNFNNATQLFKVFGDGGVVIGANPATLGTGTINVQNGYYVNGALVVGGANITPPGVHHGMIVDDNEGSDDQGFFRPVPTNVGPLQVNGPLVGNATAVFGTPAGAATTVIMYGVGFHSASPMIVQGSLTSGVSNGLYVFAGGNNADDAFVVNNAANTANLMVVSGDGGVAIGNGVADPGPGNLQVINAVIGGTLVATGATPAVSVAQTALGTSTTTTVITTAGGIALPALASTFWRVNVNGVAYGIPCFAL